MFGVSRGKVVIISLLLFFIVFSWGIYKDLKLTGLRSPGDTLSKVPEVTVTDLHFDKVVSGDVWKLDSEEAQKLDGEILAHQVVVKLTKKDGQVWITESPSALFVEKDGTITMHTPKGKGEGHDFSLVWDSSRAILNQKLNEVVFPKDLFVSSDRGITIAANSGKILGDGSIILTNGVRANWLNTEQE